MPGTVGILREMSADWLLIETLGDEPTVIAVGSRLRKATPLRRFLNSSARVHAICAAVDESASTGQPTRIEWGKHVVQAIPVLMTDERVHGVQVWAGSGVKPAPPRPRIGAVVWNLTTRVAADTRSALLNAGLDPAVEPTHGRFFAADLPVGELHPNEIHVLTLALRSSPGDTISDTWNLTTRMGNPITVSFFSRVVVEESASGEGNILCRAMNWRESREVAYQYDQHLADRILRGMTDPSVYRVLVDLDTWGLLKWIDAPCPLFDWRGINPHLPLLHPDDRPIREAMAREFDSGPASGILRMRSGSGWTLIHVTIYRIELEHGVMVGLLSLRVPTDAEVVEASYRISSSAS